MKFYYLFSISHHTQRSKKNIWIRVMALVKTWVWEFWETMQKKLKMNLMEWEFKFYLMIGIMVSLK